MKRMASLQAFTIAVWLVIAISATQLVAGMWESRKDIIDKTLFELRTGDPPFEPVEAWKQIRKVEEYIKEEGVEDRYKYKLGPGFTLETALRLGHYMRYLGRVRIPLELKDMYGGIEYMSDYYQLYQQVDKQTSETVRDFITYCYEGRMKLHGETFVAIMENFAFNFPNQGEQFKEFFDAIVRNEKLWAELRGDATALSDDMQNALADVLKSKTPDVDDDYKSKAILKLRESCKDWHRGGVNQERKSIEVVKKLGKTVKQPGEYVYYFDLCDRADATVLPWETPRRNE